MPIDSTLTQYNADEQLYRSLARVLPNSLVILFNHELRCLIVEGSTLEAHGLSRDLLEGSTLYTALSPEHLPFFEMICQNALAGASASYEYAFGERVYQLSVQPTSSDHGEIFAGIIVAQDVTPFAQVQEQLNERVRQLTVLTRVESELAAHLNIDYVLMMALDSAVRLSHADAGFIALHHNGNWDHMKFIGQYPEATVRAFVKRGMGIVSRVIRQQQAELVTDVQNDPDYVAVLPQTCAQIIVPLLSRDALVGVLSLEISKPDRFTAQTLDLTRLITARVAQAIDNSRLYQQTADQLQEMQQLYERVSRLEQLKTDMIRIASHDLRNPLSVILSYSGMLQTELKSPNPRGTALEYAENIDLASQQMRKIIINILSLERIEEAAKEMQLDECSLREVVEHSFAEHYSMAALKSHDYQLLLETDAAVVHGDLMQLSEAVGNLIGNAIKYTPEGGQVIVSLAAIGDRLIFKVEDNGFGIKEAQQSRLFQPFFRARMPETRDIEGTGLGLHLVKNIIERHHGSMFFESEYGKGSTFGFEIRRAPTYSR
jgi:signal transduction histidine kinase